MTATAPLATKTSSRPSWSKSAQITPKPVRGRLGLPSPKRFVASRNVPLPSFRYKVFVSCALWVMNRS